MCCMLNGWFSSNDDICPDNCYYSRFKLKDKCRSAKCGTAFCRRGEIHSHLLPVPRRCRVRRDVVWWWFYSLWCLRSVWNSVKPMTGKFFLFPVPRVVVCVCMLNGWFSSNDEICAANFIYFRFKLKDKCRSAKWEVYLDRAHYHQGGP